MRISPPDLFPLAAGGFSLKPQPPAAASFASRPHKWPPAARVSAPFQH